MIIDLLTSPGPKGVGLKIAFACPIHVSHSHTKFDWISSKGLGGDSIMDRKTDGQTDRQTDGGDYNIPFAFFLKKALG